MFRYIPIRSILTSRHLLRPSPIASSDPSRHLLRRHPMHSSDPSHHLLRRPLIASSDSSITFVRTVSSFVFWDLDCSVPKEGDPCLVYNRIGSALESIGIESPKWIKAYGNFSKVGVPISTQKALHSSGIDLIHVPECERHRICSFLKKDILTWASQNHPPAHIFLITDDCSLSSIIQHLRRKKYNIFLSCNDVTKHKFSSQGCTLMWPWRSLAKGMACIPWKFNEVPDVALYQTLNGQFVLNQDVFEKKRGVKEALRLSKQPKLHIACSTSRDAAPYQASSVICELLKYEEKIVYCRTSQEIEKVIMELSEKTKHYGAQQVPIGLDIEWKPFQGGENPNKIAAIQICVEFDRAYCYVFHIWHSGFPLALKALLENKLYVKVGMGIARDAKKLANEYNVNIHPVEDIADLAYAKLGRPTKSWGLAYLTHVVLHKKLEKPEDIRLGNWEADILTEGQLQYAATNAYASLYVYKVLTKMKEA